jgi:predicted Holliday junction resolvase-like endonuclease
VAREEEQGRRKREERKERKRKRKRGKEKEERRGKERKRKMGRKIKKRGGKIGEGILEKSGKLLGKIGKGFVGFFPVFRASAHFPGRR